eukprot:GAHX01001382.1.p1 GENE.GAHX01001382.1~~GAHX01001382.1.p1  ORF type:complete len:643 (-),score=116.89 GAHX01001382.1:664-2592(-)
MKSINAVYEFDKIPRNDSPIKGSTTQIKHKMSTILSYNKVFLKNNMPFFVNFIKIIKKSDKSIIINESSGSGKTFFFDTMEDLTNSACGEEIKSITTEENKASLKESFQDVLCIRFSLQSIFNQSCENSEFNEVLFAKKLNLALISEIKKKIYINKDFKSELIRFEKEIIMEHGNKTQQYLVWYQTNLYSRLLCFLMQEIDNPPGLYKNKSYNNNKANSKGDRISKIICLIDEANIHVSKGLYSLLFSDKEQYRNFMIKLIQDTYLFDHEGYSRKNMVFILSSIIPFSLKRRSECKGLQIADFSNIISKTSLNFESFAELSEQDFVDIAGESDTKEDTNILRKIVNDVKKGQTSMRAYMSTSISKEAKDHLDDFWRLKLKDMDFKKGINEKQKDTRILLAICRFFIYLSGQLKYIYKNKFVLLKAILKHVGNIRNKVKSLNKEMESLNDENGKKDKRAEIDLAMKKWINTEKINIGFLTNFLVNSCDSERIKIESLDGASSEIFNESFWNRLIGFRRKRSGELFPFYANETTVEKICSATDSSKMSSTESLLWQLYHMGYIKFEPSDKEGEEYQFVCANFIKCQILLDRMQNYTTKSIVKNSFTSNEVTQIKRMFELDYWDKKLATKIKKDVETAFNLEIKS